MPTTPTTTMTSSISEMISTRPQGSPSPPSPRELLRRFQLCPPPRHSSDVVAISSTAMPLGDLSLSPGPGRGQAARTRDPCLGLGQAIVPTTRTPLYEAVQVPVQAKTIPTLSEPPLTCLGFRPCLQFMALQRDLSRHRRRH